MDEMLKCVWENLIARSKGRMNFRLAIQPIVAAALAVRSGLTDAREGRPPFFWATLTQAAHRPDVVRQGWTDAGKVFVLAVVLDAIDHLIVWRNWK